MPYVAGTNFHGSNTYTVTSTDVTDYDLFPGQPFLIVVNDEQLANLETELAGFSGVDWHVYQAAWQSRMSPLEVATPISGGVDNYSPAGWADGSYDTLLISGTGTLPTLTGLAGGLAWRRATLINTGSVAIVLAHQGGGSNEGNRMILPGLGSLSLAVGGAVTLLYHAGSVNRWRFAA